MENKTSLEEKVDWLILSGMLIGILIYGINEESKKYGSYSKMYESYIETVDKTPSFAFNPQF